MTTCLKLNNLIDYNTKIKDLTTRDIKLIEDKPLQQAIFHILIFFEPISFGNLLFSDKDCRYYYGYDINKININNVKELLDTKNSLHYSHSSYVGYKRSYSTSVSNSGFTIDIDYYNTKYKGLTPQELVKVMKKDGAFTMLEPSYIIYSGNGMNLVYLLKNINTNTNLSDVENYKNNVNIEKRRSIIKALISNFEEYGADKKCHDITRLNKLPGGFNYKTGKAIEIIDYNIVINKPLKRRTLGHLYNQFVKLEYIEPIGSLKPRKKVKPDRNNKKVSSSKPVIKKNTITNNDTVKPFKEYRVNIDGVIHLRNTHSLNTTRLNDLEYLLSNRDDFNGNRNSFLHLYSVILRKTTDDLNFIWEKVQEINNSFPEKIINITYLKNQIYKDDFNYNYKNDEIISMLNINKEEMKYLKTIISTEEKYRRKNIKRNQERRNENGLTEREQAKLDNMEQVAKFLDEGLKQKEIAEKMNLSKGRVSQIVKEIKAL